MIKPGLELTSSGDIAPAFLIRVQIICRNVNLLTKYGNIIHGILAEHQKEEKSTVTIIFDPKFGGIKQ